MDAQVTDRGLEHLKGLNKLRELGLNGVRVTDAGLEHVEGLVDLEELYLHGTQVGDAGLERLEKLTSLRLLYLAGTRVTDAGLEHLEGLNSLEELYLYNTQVGDVGLERVEKLKSLRLLHLGRTRITDAGIKHVKGLTSLEDLWVYQNGITDAGVEHLKQMTQLKGLLLGDTRVTDAGLEHLEGLTSLEMLGLNGTQITDAGLVHLKGLTHLRELRFIGTRISSAGLEHLKQLTDLETLQLERTRVTDAGLVHLKGLTHLRELRLNGTKISGGGLENLKELADLETLYLGYTQVTDDGLGHLRGLTSLEEVGLANTQVTDAGLVHMRGLKNLELLNLSTTKITDAGLRHLNRLTNLRELRLGRTVVTGAGVRDLHEALPTLMVFGVSPHFPHGAASFADAVDNCDPLYGGGPAPIPDNPSQALGPRGKGDVSLGHGGRITLRFTDNVLIGSGDNAPDLAIFEIGSTENPGRAEDEATFVEISPSGSTWYSVGRVSGGTSTIDIDSYGFGPSDRFSFVRLTDDPNQGGSAGSTVGADIDAVGAISTIPTALIGEWMDSLAKNLKSDDPDVRGLAAFQMGKYKAPKAKETLAGLLKDKEPVVRRRAAVGLAVLGEPAGSMLELIRQSVTDDDPTVRADSLKVLGAANDQESVVLAIKAIEDTTVRVRCAAVATLGDLKNPSAIEALAGVIDDADLETAKAAALSLGKVKSSESTALLKRLATKSGHPLCVSIAVALHHAGEAGTAERFRQLLEEEDIAIRREAAAALGKLAKLDGTDLYIQALDDDDAQVRKIASTALSQSDDPRAEKALKSSVSYRLDQLVPLLSDRDYRKRSEAMRALRELGPEAAPTLLGRLEKASMQVRYDLASTIAHLRNPAVIQPSAEKLENPNLASSLRYPYENILRSLPDESREAVEELVGHEQPVVRESGIRLLSAYEDAEATKSLKAALKDGSARVRGYAALGLSRQKNPDALRVLKENVKDSDPTVRSLAVSGLGGFDAKTALPILTGLVEDSDRMLSSYLVNALGRFKEEEATSAIVELSKKHSSVSSSAFYALRRQDTPGAARALGEFLKDKDENIQRRARSALQGMRTAEAKKILGQNPAPRDRYAVPAGGVEELLTFIENVKAFQPQTSSQSTEHRQRAPASLTAAAKRILSLEKDKWSKAYQTGLLVLLEDRIRLLPRVDPEQQQQTIGFVKLFLRAKIEEGGKSLRADDVDLAMSTGAALESTGNFELAAKAYRELAEIVAKDDSKEKSESLEMLEGAVRRLSLEGKELELGIPEADDAKIDWAHYRGKAVLFLFWSSQSELSLLEMHRARKLHEMYRDRGFDVLCICIDRDCRPAKKLLEDEQFPWSTLFAENPDSRHPLVTHFGVTTAPAIMVVDKQGKVGSPRIHGDDLETWLVESLGPPHFPKGKLTFIDLSSKANLPLTQRVGNLQDNDLSELPQGDQSFAGVTFHIADAAIQLAGQNLRTRPENIEGIPVDEIFNTIYFLHATAWNCEDGTVVGRYRVNYQGGAVAEIPVVYGQDVRDWYCRSDVKPATRGTIAWIGRNPHTRRSGGRIRLYLTAWENPQPDKKVLSIDYVSLNTTAAPFCVAITMEHREKASSESRE
jgi:HEAT repeat protein/Leucine-rich repeat (LRR) protein